MKTKENNKQMVQMVFEGCYKVRTYELIGGHYSRVKENLYADEKKANARFNKLAREIAQ